MILFYNYKSRVLKAILEAACKTSQKGHSMGNKLLHFSEKSKLILFSPGDQVEDIGVDFPPVDPDVVHVAESPNKCTGTSAIENQNVTYLFGEIACDISHNGTHSSFQCNTLHKRKILLNVFVLNLFRQLTPNF